MVLEPEIVKQLRNEEKSGELEKETFADNVLFEKNKDFFKTAIDNSLDSFFLIDRIEMRFIDVNKTACESTGYSKEELLKMGPQDIKPEFNKEELIKKFDSVLNSATKKGVIKTVHERKDGTTFPVEVYLSCLETENIIIASVRDISERIKAEENIKASEKELRDFFDNANDLIQSVDSKGNFRYVNKKWKEVMGYSDEDIANLNFTDILREDCVPHCKNLFKELAEGKSFDNVDVVFKTKSGKEVFVNGNINSNIVDGNFVSTRGIFRDLTSTKKAQNKLSEVKEIVDNSSIVTFTWRNADGWPVEHVSENVEKVFGYSSEDFLSGKIMFEKCIHPDDLKRVSDEVEKNSKDVNKTHFEHEPYKIITKNGSERYILDRSQIIRDSEGKITHYKGIIEDVTEKQKIINEIVETKNKYSTLVEKSTDGIIIVQDKKFKFANKALSKITGFSVDELTGMGFLEAVERSERERLADRYMKRLKGEDVPEFYKTKIVCKNGETKPVEISANIIEYQKKPAILAILRDISKREEIEKKLIESETLFRTLVEHSTVGVYIHDPVENKLLYSNPLMNEILRIQDTKDVDLFKYIHPEDAKLIKERTKKRMAGEKVNSAVEIRIYPPEKEMMWIRIYTSFVNYKDKQVALASVVDVTDVKIATEKLIESEKKFREMAELLPEIVFEIDLNGNLKYANKAAFDKFAYTKEDFDEGLNVFGLISSSDSEKIKQNISKILKGEKAESHDYVAVRKDGSTFAVQIYSSPIFLDKKPVGLRGVIVDISERKKYEQKLSEQFTKLDVLNEIISQGVKTKDTNIFFEKTLNVLIEKMNYHSGGIYLVDKNNKTASIVYSKNIPEKFLKAVEKVEIDTEPYYKIFKNKETIKVKNYDKTDKNGVTPSFKAVISLPIESDDVVVGALNISKLENEEFTDSEIDLLKAACSEIGNVVKMIKYEENLKEKIDELERWKKVTVGREIQMNELKDKIKKLETQK